MLCKGIFLFFVYVELLKENLIALLRFYFNRLYYLLKCEISKRNFEARRFDTMCHSIKNKDDWKILSNYYKKVENKL